MRGPSFLKETCMICGDDMHRSDHYDDICDACAQDEGFDGPWNWDDEGSDHYDDADE